jgi:hypothetical protein
MADPGFKSHRPLPQAGGPCQPGKRRRVRASPCARAVPTQRHGGLDLRRYLPSQVAIPPNLALQRGDQPRRNQHPAGHRGLDARPRGAPRRRRAPRRRPARPGRGATAAAHADPEGSDSAQLDNALELLVRAAATPGTRWPCWCRRWWRPTRRSPSACATSPATTPASPSRGTGPPGWSSPTAWWCAPRRPARPGADAPGRPRARAAGPRPQGRAGGDVEQAELIDRRRLQRYRGTADPAAVPPDRPCRLTG